MWLQWAHTRGAHARNTPCPLLQVSQTLPFAPSLLPLLTYRTLRVAGTWDWLIVSPSLSVIQLQPQHFAYKSPQPLLLGRQA